MSDPTTCDVALVERRAAEIRELIFKAQSIILLAGRAAMADERNADWPIKHGLSVADGFLSEATERLEPEAITEAVTARESAEVDHAQA